MPSSPHPASTPRPFTWDRFSLYELCAQNPPRDAKLLRAIHADRVARWSPAGASPGVACRSPAGSSASSRPHPLILGEDFCGTAALSRAWCSLSPTFRAIATDIHAPTIARAKRDTPAALRDRITYHRTDVRKVTDPVDCIAVLNFSICELHARRDLVAYFAHARKRLARRTGVLICDLYGGADSYQTGLLDQTVSPPREHPAAKDKILYSWEQRTADPLTARVVNAMHFDVQCKVRKNQIFLDAFVYDWRLWTIPELREAMHDAGFKHTAVYPRTAGATDAEGNLYTQPIEDPTELDEAFNVFVAAS